MTGWFNYLWRKVTRWCHYLWRKVTGWLSVDNIQGMVYLWTLFRGWFICGQNSEDGLIICGEKSGAGLSVGSSRGLVYLWRKQQEVWSGGRRAVTCWAG